VSIFGKRGSCNVCRKELEIPKRKPIHRRVIDLTTPQLTGMLYWAGMEGGAGDFSMLGFMASSLRRGEVIGEHTKRVDLPGVQVENVNLRDEYVWIRGKGIEQEIQIPVPRRILQAGLLVAGSRLKGRLFDDPFMSTQKLAIIVKRYARMAEIHDWKDVRTHRLRQWFSNTSKQLGGYKPGPEGLVEWIDLMRHSRKGQGVTVGFYGGPSTPFERRKEISDRTLGSVLAGLPESFPFETRKILV
jgi:integrase